MVRQTLDYRPEDGDLGSFEENRAWQARFVFERTTPAERLEMVEAMLNELGDDCVLAAIERKLAERERSFKPPPPIDR
ncbi:MAG: hypothetical protein QM754_00490 [Tepidisphaeraceae bacterium]